MAPKRGYPPKRGQPSEKRADTSNGVEYTLQEFKSYYGVKEGQKRWDSSAATARRKAEAKAKARAEANGPAAKLVATAKMSAQAKDASVNYQDDCKLDDQLREFAEGSCVRIASSKNLPDISSKLAWIVGPYNPESDLQEHQEWSVARRTHLMNILMGFAENDQVTILVDDDTTPRPLVLQRTFLVPAIDPCGSLLGSGFFADPEHDIKGSPRLLLMKSIEIMHEVARYWARGPCKWSALGHHMTAALAQVCRSLDQHPLRSALKVQAVATALAKFSSFNKQSLKSLSVMGSGPESLLSWHVNYVLKGGERLMLLLQMLQEEFSFMAVMRKVHCIPVLPVTPPSNKPPDNMLQNEFELDEPHQEVIEECFHDEPPAVPDGSEENLGDIAWASHVEARIRHEKEAEEEQAEEEQAEEEHADEHSEEVYLLQFSRCPEVWCEALMNACGLRGCRQELEKAGYDCLLPSGAKLFIHPSQQPFVVSALDGRVLKHHHVIVTKSLEHLVEESLTQIPRCTKVKLKSKTTVEPFRSNPDEMPPAAFAEEHRHDTANMDVAVIDEEDFELIEARTFLCIAPPLRNANSVVQSTPHGFVNPRRVATRL